MVLLPLDTVCLDEITRTVAAMLPPAKDKANTWERRRSENSWKVELDPDRLHTEPWLSELLVRWDAIFQFSLTCYQEHLIDKAWQFWCDPLCTEHRWFIRLQPGQEITTWHNGLSCPHSYLFSTLYPSAITPKQSDQTVSLLKHPYELSIFYREIFLAWQTRSLGIRASFVILLVSQHSFHARAHHASLPSVPQHITPLCVFWTIHV